MASMSLAKAQIRHLPPIRSLRSRAVVTLGPTVQEVDNEGSSNVGVRKEGNDLGVWLAEELSSAAGVGSGCTWDIWNMWPQAKPIRTSFSVANDKKNKPLSRRRYFKVILSYH